MARTASKFSGIWIFESAARAHQEKIKCFLNEEDAPNFEMQHVKGGGRGAHRSVGVFCLFWLRRGLLPGPGFVLTPNNQATC